MDDVTLEIREQAEAVAVEAKAVKPCRWHPEVLIDQYDGDAKQHAYAIGTNRWKSGRIPGERQEFMDAIKDVIDQSADECPCCKRIEDE